MPRGIDPHAERRVRSLCEAAGLKVAAIERAGSGHYKALVVAPDGRRTKACISSTPSEHRNEANTRAWLRRFALNRSPG